MFVSYYLRKFLTFSLPVLVKRVIIPTYLRTSISRRRQEQTLPLPRTFFKEYSISFLMVCRLIDFALVVLELLMFKVCGIIGISKIQFFNFPGNERVKLYLSHRKKLSKLLFLTVNNSSLGACFYSQFNSSSSLGYLVVGSSLIRKKGNMPK